MRLVYTIHQISTIQIEIDERNSPSDTSEQTRDPQTAHPKPTQSNQNPLSSIASPRPPDNRRSWWKKALCAAEKAIALLLAVSRVGLFFLA